MPPAEASSPVRRGVSIALFHEGRVLIGRRLKQPYLGLWSFPGGSVEPGETLEQAAHRELIEETGLLAASLLFVESFSVRTAGWQLNLFAGEMAGGVMASLSDLGEPRFIHLAGLAEIETTPMLDEFAAKALNRLRKAAERG